MAIRPDEYEVLTFDCYGTLIDWETGIVAALTPVLNAHQVAFSTAELLGLYSNVESEIQRGPFIEYSEVLRRVVRDLGKQLEFVPSAQEENCLLHSLVSWQPFPDSAAALQRLRSRYRLGIISNVDDDLFAGSARHFEVEFDFVVTSQQMRSYKPCLQNFRAAAERAGVESARILHVAESLYHDVAPARKLGIDSVWVNRGRGRPRATRRSDTAADLEVPDLDSLVCLVGLGTKS